MEDPDDPSSDPTSFSNPLPPGARFFPSEQQLLCYYLASKNDAVPRHGIDVIKEVDLYNFEPFNLPEPACFRFGTGGRRRHWYCYVERLLNGGGGRRRAATGYWRKRRRVRDVVGEGAGKAVVGTRKSFVFYLGDSSGKAVRTHWVMYEYALTTDHLQHHSGSFVLCRIFSKSNMRNSLSEHIISSCGDGSVASVRHVGVQCDSKTQERNSHDDDDDDDDGTKVQSPTEQCNEFDGDVGYGPVYGKDLVAILDGDFIELDDLLSPLPGVD